VRQASAEQPTGDIAARPQAADVAQTEERPAGGERRGRGGRGGGGGYGSIVDAGSVLMVLTPASELVVYEPSATEFKELARYKVAETPTYAYPVVSGNRIFVKDQNAVALWAVE
jgi:hypothetical protein